MNGSTPSRSSERQPRRAFTLIEMLVVIAVIVVVLATVVPSIARIMRSTNYAAAVNSVTATLGRARAAAMESGQPTAVAFLFDIKARTYTMLVLELAPSGEAAAIAMGPPQRGEPDSAKDLKPARFGAGTNSIAAYQPLPFSQAVELPKGTAVLGLSHLIPEIDTDLRNPPTFDSDRNGEVDPIASSNAGKQFDLQRWYAGEIPGDGDGVPKNNILPWIFPRSDPRLYLDEGLDPWRIMSGDQPGNLDEARAAVRHAQTFAIAFRPDGSVSANFGIAGLSPGLVDAYIEWPNEPLDQTGGVNRPYDLPNAFDPGVLHLPPQDQTKPNPEVRLRTASELAVVDLNLLQAGAGVSQPWLVRTSIRETPGVSLAPHPKTSSDPKNRLINDDFVRSMSKWIDENAQIIGFNRYTGATVKR